MAFVALVASVQLLLISLDNFSINRESQDLNLARSGVNFHRWAQTLTFSGLNRTADASYLSLADLCS